LGYDVWEDFVIPPFYDRLDLTEARKPRIIVGGRGCGKTMLLRYLSHQTMLSQKRDKIPEEATRHIGLYWRADTQFVNAMAKRDKADDVWESAFNHLVALELGKQALASLQSLAGSACPMFQNPDLASMDFGRLRAMDLALPTTYGALCDELESRLWHLQGWVNDIRKVSEPRFLPGRQFVIALVKVIKEQVPALGDTIFFVYLDEYENLRQYQKEIIHTCLKHSDADDGLIFNIAVKRNALGVPHTVGPESIAQIHDWRYHDLEAYLLEENFPVFAGEILLLNLCAAGIIARPISIEDLRDPGALGQRKSPEYAKAVLAKVRKVFPGVSQEELAKGVFETPELLNRLRRWIKRALPAQASRSDVERFLRPTHPKASVIVPALLHRSSLRTNDVLEELDKLEQGKPNRFTGRTNWIHNNFIGCVLNLYEPYARACPFYAGFDAFCGIAHGNIRHLLELCHKSVQQALRDQACPDVSMTPQQEAEAARAASAAFLGEVRAFGPLGNQLYSFALRLGSLLALSHKRPTQSEPEVSHFSIGRGKQQIGSAESGFLQEAVKWSVLFEEKLTKQKERLRPAGSEYVLNPIYAPYFHITYRKRRRLNITSDDAIVLIHGTYDQVKAMLRRYSKRWSVDLNSHPTLFSHLEQEDEA